MKNKPSQDIKRTLEQEAAELTKRLRQFTSTSVHDRDGYSARFPQFGAKDDENAAEVATFQDNLSLERNLEASLREVESALARIDGGTYGRCERCRQPIDAERLRALPAASRHVTCPTDAA